MNDFPDPGTAAASGTLAPVAAQPAAGLGMPTPALHDGALRRQRWAQAWDGAPGPVMAGPLTPGLANASSTAPRPTPGAVADAAPAATRTLAEWRSRHARQGAEAPAAPADMALATRRPRLPADEAGATSQAQAAALLPAAPAPGGAGQGEPATHGASAADELRGLVESCCSRVLVAPAGAGAAPGVLLDLGRWMPGCSIEVARTAGVLRLTLRGAAVERRAGLVDSLGQLRDQLAQSLGCPVVLAIDDASDGSRR